MRVRVRAGVRVRVRVRVSVSVRVKVRVRLLGRALEVRVHERGRAKAVQQPARDTLVQVHALGRLRVAVDQLAEGLALKTTRPVGAWLGLRLGLAYP